MILDFGIPIDFSLSKIRGDHLAGAQRAFFDHSRFVDGHHPGFRACNKHVVRGQRVAHGPQTVPVHSGANPNAVGYCEGRRTVPRLHDRVVVAVHVAPRGGDFGRAFGNCFRNEYGLGHRSASAGAHHHFKHSIQSGGIRRSQGNDRLYVFRRITEGRGSHSNLVALQPIQVALDGVDFAVVGEHPERLRQPPLRERVRRIALVVDREGRDEPLVLEIRIELRDLFSEHHPLVNDRSA